MSAPARIVALTLFALGAGAADAAVFCVGTPDELAAAIIAGRLNHQPDEYRLRSGSFPLMAPIQVFAFDAQGASFSGGWSASCATQDRTPGATVIDGQGVVALLDVREPGAPPVAFALEYLTLRNGRTVDGHVVAIAGLQATVVVSHCVFEGNVAGGAARAVLAVRTGQPVDVLDNAFVGNVFAGRAIDVDLLSQSQSDGARRHVAGNTIAFNPATGGSAIRSGRAATIANNLTWGNGTTTDIDASGGSIVLGNSLQHGTSIPGNTSVDPLLHAGTWQLRGVSPLRDAGAGSGVTGPTSTHDLEQEPRVQGTAIDVGADELGPALFADGYE